MSRTRRIVLSLAIVLLVAGGASIPFLMHDSTPDVPATIQTSAPKDTKTELVVVASSSPAKSEDTERSPEEIANDQWLAQVFADLLSHNDADSLAVAALIAGPARMTSGAKPVSTKNLLLRAAALAPESASIQALALMACMVTSACDPAQYENALRRADPKNALGWIRDVALAEKLGDATAVDAALKKMAATERLDMYWSANVSRVADKIESSRVAPPDSLTSASVPALTMAATVGAIGTMAAIPVPYASLTNACRPPVSDQRRTLCMQVGGVMRSGDSLITQSVGIALEKLAALPDSQDALNASAEKRQLSWLMRARPPESSFDFAEWIRLVRENRTEQQVYEAWLTSNGIPLKPPADWSSSN